MPTRWVTAAHQFAGANPGQGICRPVARRPRPDGSNVNPVYAELRDAAWSHMQANGGSLDPRVLASLDRVRDMSPQERFVMVDAAGARLYMIEAAASWTHGVIVGKADPSTQTPMLASTIYYATLNPYWHVRRS